MNHAFYFELAGWVYDVLACLLYGILFFIPSCCTHHNIVQMAKDTCIEKQWNTVSTSDMFTLSDYKQYQNMIFELSFYTQVLPMNFQMRNLKVKIYGIK